MITRAQALEMDKADRFAAKRAEFNLPEDVIYLDGNSLGVLPRAAVARVKHAVGIEWGRDLITSWNKHGWFQLPHKAGDKIARLIGAVPGSVVVTDSISINLFKVLSAAVAISGHAKLFYQTAAISRLIFMWRKGFPHLWRMAMSFVLWTPKVFMMRSPKRWPL